ncbi:MAG: NADH-quinone oxidoreductase subunit J, partial [Anaerolineales bacterium]
MTVMQVVFLITAVVSLGGAVMVVTARNLIHAALWLILTLFGVAVMYGLLSATFFTVIQVVIYIGAITILMIFAIMLTRRIRQEP